MAGTYRLQTHFPAQWYNWTLYGGANIWYKASDSFILELIVKEDPIPIYQSVPLPTEYWTRPINAQFREWAPIAGNFLESIRYDSPLVPYQKMPETGHILWTKPLEFGGLAGGEVGDHSYDHGDAYEGKFTGSVVINGVLFYNDHESRGGTDVEHNIIAVDLHTGEELWRRNWDNTMLDFGQLFYWDSYNLHGVFPYLWQTTGSTWRAFDASTGRWVYTIENVPSGTTYRGSKGEFYRLVVDQDKGWMAYWNSSAIVSMEGSWRPHGNTYNAAASTSAARRAWAWNVSIPTGLPGGVDGDGYYKDRIIGTTADSRTARINIQGVSATPVSLWGISLKPGREGQVLFQRTWQRPAGNISIDFGHAGEGVFTLWSKETRQLYGFDINTGEYLWATEPQHYLDTFGIRIKHRLGKIYTVGFAGTVYCYDPETGKTLWTYDATDPYTEILWGENWPLLFAFFTGDGKILMFHMEHSPVDPLPRGAPTIILDAETGKLEWSLNIRGNRWGGHNVIGDGIIAFFNSYDNRIYAIGKGPSATTVTASPKVSVYGSSVLVEGMVTDISPGTDDYALKARFPHGVPAVSDASMSEWMQYVHMQFPRPSNVTGVDVILTVLDPNNNIYDIGTAKTDSSGTYSFMWKPLVPGKYTVIATFAGSKAYYASFAETAVGIEEAPEATPAPTPEPASAAELYFVPATTGIILAIAVVGAVIVLMLRKR